jgi:hypothetical protein
MLNNSKLSINHEELLQFDSIASNNNSFTHIDNDKTAIEYNG